MQIPTFKKSIPFLILLIPFLANAQQFSLKGTYEGSATDKIFFSYLDANKDYLIDTLKIEDSKFETSGTLYGTQKVQIYGTPDPKGMEDPNLGSFFIEPGDIKIQLKENKFKELIVAGSQTQKEFKPIFNKTYSIHQEINSILESQPGNSRELVQAKLDKVKEMELRYAYNNPKSFLSPYYVDFYKTVIPADSVVTYYNNFDRKTKESMAAESIKEYLEKDIAHTGDAAPDFNTTDLNGNTISLDSFNGKYLLIDFWAGWCVPCVKNLPELKSLHQKYNDKGLEVLGVSFDETSEKWKTSVKKHEIETWNQIYVGLNKLETPGTISQKYNIRPIPAYILIDREGKIVDRYMSASFQGKDFDDLAKKVEEIFRE